MSEENIYGEVACSAAQKISVYADEVSYEAWQAAAKAAIEEYKRRTSGEWIERVILSVAEIPDRNSPEYFPEAMLVTASELRMILEENAPPPLELPRQCQAALLWLLWHHQGGSSEIGQPIRKLLGISAHSYLTDEQVALAKSFKDR